MMRIAISRINSESSTTRQVLDAVMALGVRSIMENQGPILPQRR